MVPSAARGMYPHWYPAMCNVFSSVVLRNGHFLLCKRLYRDPARTVPPPLHSYTALYIIQLYSAIQYTSYTSSLWTRQ